MNLSADIVGTAAGPLEHLVDARWIMAYSAALGELNPAAVPHPLFPVCYEWPVSQPVRAIAELLPLADRLVHAQHDLRIRRHARAGETVRASARIVAAEPRSPGAFVVYRFETRGADGELLTVSDFGALYRGVRLDRSGGEPVEDPAALALPLQRIGEVAVSATAAHVYTECARIWNPIHTDVAYARAAGLPDIILHGTATLALSVSSIMKHWGVRAQAVRRVRCRFSGMVLMPSTIAVHAAREGGTVAFETRDERGEPVIGRAQLLLE